MAEVRQQTVAADPPCQMKPEMTTGRLQPVMKGKQSLSPLGHGAVSPCHGCMEPVVTADELLMSSLVAACSSERQQPAVSPTATPLVAVMVAEQTAASTVLSVPLANPGAAEERRRDHCPRPDNTERAEEREEVGLAKVVEQVACV